MKTRLLFTTIFTVLNFSNLSECFGDKVLLLKNTEFLGETSLKNKNHEICFNGLEDIQKDSTIGHLNNCIGGKYGNVRTMQNVDLWINKKISTMLKIAGYSVKTDCFEKDRKFIINGQILKVCTIGYFGYEGKVIINVNVSSDSTIIINRSYTGLKRIGDPPCSYATKLFEKTLKDALDSAISQIA